MGARWLCWLGFLVACSPPPVAHEPSMFFGDVALGESRTVALTLTNHADQPQALTFEILEGDFHLDEPGRTLRANEATTLLVHFIPADLGPRTGRLAINGAELALDGRGTGARVSAPAQLVPGPFALVSGQPEKLEHAVLLLRNTGTAGSGLELGRPRVDGAELCIGEFAGATCEPWEPPAALDTQTLLQVPLAFRVTAPGPRRWEVVFPSNDFLQPELTVEVLAYVEALEPCVFAPVPEVVLNGGVGGLQLTHAGPGTCLIRELTVSPATALTLQGLPRLPLRLDSGESSSVWVAVRPLAPLQLSGFVHVVAVGTAPLDVPVRRDAPLGNCLVLGPETVDFGTLAQGCSSFSRSVNVYNSCSSALTLAALSLFATGGEPAGTPGCPGPTPCQEFFVGSAPPPGTEVRPAATLSFSVNYRPAGLGADNGAVLVRTAEGPEAVLSLRGLAAPPPIQVDSFRQDTLPKADVLVMVDSSPSFVPKRAGVRTNLQNLMTSWRSRCVDARWAFAAADGAPDAGVELLQNDAGARWTSTREPDFVNRALSAFDALPVGSELEACIGPAADLVQDAGLRTGSSFGGVCITDALEQSATPAAALQVLLAHPNSSWSTITGVETSTCAVEAIDDGVHQGLVTTSSGARADICEPSWWSQFVPLGLSCFGYRTTFYLTSRSRGPLELALDGQPVPSADWTYDPTNNAVTFLPGREPGPGQTLTVTYTTTCTP